MCCNGNTLGVQNACSSRPITHKTFLEMCSLDKLSCDPVDRSPISFPSTLVVLPPSGLLSFICSFIQKECTLETTVCWVRSSVNRENREMCSDLTNTLMLGHLKTSDACAGFTLASWEAQQYLMCVLLIGKFIAKFVFSNSFMQCTFSVNKMKYFSRGLDCKCSNRWI